MPSAGTFLFFFLKKKKREDKKPLLNVEDVFSPQLTPADSSSLSDYSSEPALYFWSLRAVRSITASSHLWLQPELGGRPNAALLPPPHSSWLQAHHSDETGHSVISLLFVCFFVGADFLPPYNDRPHCQIRAENISSMWLVSNFHQLSFIKQQVQKAAGLSFPSLLWTVDLSASLFPHPHYQAIWQNRLHLF